jgi:hypothetical protein
MKVGLAMLLFTFLYEYGGNAGQNEPGRCSAREKAAILAGGL